MIDSCDEREEGCDCTNTDCCANDDAADVFAVAAVAIVTAKFEFSLLKLLLVADVNGVVIVVEALLLPVLVLPNRYGPIGFTYFTICNCDRPSDLICSAQYSFFTTSFATSELTLTSALKVSKWPQ